MKTVLLVTIVCCSITLVGCFPPSENVQPSQRYIKVTGVIQKVDVRAGIEDPLVTAFAVSVPGTIYKVKVEAPQNNAPEETQ